MFIVVIVNLQCNVIPQIGGNVAMYECNKECEGLLEHRSLKFILLGMSISFTARFAL